MESKLKELKFYRFKSDINNIGGSIIIEIPVTKEKLEYLNFNIKRKLINYLFNIKISSMRFWDVEEEDRVEITIEFYLGNTFYKKVTDRCLIDRLCHGKETVCINGLNESHKIYIYCEKYPNIVFNWEDLLNNMINNFYLYSNRLIFPYVEPQGYSLSILIKLLKTLINE